MLTRPAWVPAEMPLHNLKGWVPSKKSLRPACRCAMAYEALLPRGVNIAALATPLT